MPTFVLHGINPSPPGVTVHHVWTLLEMGIGIFIVSCRQAYKLKTQKAYLLVCITWI